MRLNINPKKFIYGFMTSHLAFPISISKKLQIDIDLFLREKPSLKKYREVYGFPNKFKTLAEFTFENVPSNCTVVDDDEYYDEIQCFED